MTSTSFDSWYGSSDPEAAKIRAVIDKLPPAQKRSALDQLRSQYDTAQSGNELQGLKDDLTGVRDDNLAAIDELIGTTVPQIGMAGQSAAAQEQFGLNNLTNAVNGFQDVTAPGYVGDMTSQAAGAQADPYALAAQRKALDQLGALTTPEVTAKERYLMETARRQQERDQRSYMDAVMQQLGARGIRSGGAEAAAAAAGQRETGNRRMVQDLGTMAGAVDRSMNALSGYADLSTHMRDSSFNEDFNRKNAADSALKFNKDLRSTYDRWTTELEQKQREGAYGRTKDLANAQTVMAQDRYKYTTDPLKESIDLKLKGIDTNNAAIPGLVDIGKTIVGQEEAERARQDAEDDKSIWGRLFG